MITESPTIRLHVEAETPDQLPPALWSEVSSIPDLDTLVDLFPQITGWEVDQVLTSPHHLTDSNQQSPNGLTSQEPFGSTSPIGNQNEGPSAELKIVDMWSQWPEGQHCANRQHCDSLIQVFNSLAQQVRSSQRQIEILNAQLATAVPLATTVDSGQILFDRLESVLKNGLTLLDANASGLYLLDDSTRELHLRVQVGLGAESLLRPSRRLKDSMPDLEALVGNPFTISQSALSLNAESSGLVKPGSDSAHDSTHESFRAGVMGRNWALPEDFPSALCVAIATHSTPLGTLWFFSKQDRVFSRKEIALAEVIGGHLSAELEKESAVREGASSRKLMRDIDRARLWHQIQSPPPLPEIEGWIVEYGQYLEQGIGGTIIDYSISSAGELVAAVGDIQGAVFESGLAASTLRGAIRTLEPRNLDAHELLFEVNNTLWNCPLGDQLASLFTIRLDPSTGITTWANSGENGALIVGRGCEAEIVDPASPLGACPDEEFEPRSRVILPGSTLLVFNSGFRRLFKYSFRKASDQDILDRIQQESILTPQDVRDWTEEMVAGFDSYRTTPDVSFVAIHRELES